MLRMIFRAAADDGGQLADVGMAVVNGEVKVSITARRLVRGLGGAAVGDAVRRLLDVVMVDYWNSETLESKVRLRRARLLQCAHARHAHLYTVCCLKGRWAQLPESLSRSF